jgi:hypothetical protein
VLLRWSKEAADQDRKEHGIEFDDYLEAVDHDVYNQGEEVNIDMDFAMLRPTERNLLQVALAFPGITTDSLSSLRFPRKPIQRALEKRGLCPVGFDWYQEGKGWSCYGGSHYVSNGTLGEWL